VYLSVDLDGFDPAHAPGVSHPEPGGLVLRDALRMLETLDKLVGADVVEYNPRCDVGHLTAVLAAKMVKEICGHVIARR
jgi:arginase family enzyme